MVKFWLLNALTLIDLSKSKKFRPLHLVVAILTLTYAVSDAQAHGPSPSVLGVFGDGEMVSHLRLTVGLASRDGDTWRWVCPAAWGGPETPVVAHSGGAPVVFADSGMVEIQDGLGVIVSGGELLNSATVRAAAASEGTTFILARIDGDHVLMAFDGDVPRTVARLQQDWQSLALVDGVPVLAMIRDDRLALAFFPLDGSESMEREVVLDGIDSGAVSVRAADGQLWVMLSAMDDYRLMSVRGEEAVPLLASDSPIHGPVRVGESLFAVSAGALWQLAGPSAEVWDDSNHYTCASETPPSGFVCAQTALFALLEQGVSAGPIFEHADLLPPRDAAGPCLGEWLDYAVHAGIDIAPPAPEADRPAPARCGSAAPIGTMGFSFFVLFLTRRRR